MQVTFSSEGHETKTFTKSLISSEYIENSNIPEQVLTTSSSTGQDGTEKAKAYAGESQYFKQGAYNQTNGKNPEDNMIWDTGAETYNGDLDKQYSNGCYAEVWFKKASVNIDNTQNSVNKLNDASSNFTIYPNPASSYLQIKATNQTIAAIQLFNIDDRCVLTKTNINSTNSTLDISKIEPGNYYSIIEDTNKQRQSSRFVKQ